MYLHQCDDAILQIREAIATDPSFPSARMGLWGAHYRKGMHEDALEEAGKFVAALGDHEGEDALRRGYAEGGYSRAMHLGAEILAKRSRRCHVPGAHCTIVCPRGRERSSDGMAAKGLRTA